jgi:hypothetical protein
MILEFLFTGIFPDHEKPWVMQNHSFQQMPGFLRAWEEIIVPFKKKKE